MQRLPYLFPMLILLAACNAESTSSGNQPANAVTMAEIGQAVPVQTIDSHLAKNLLKQQPAIIILDVRTPEEFAAGHVSNAQLLNIYDRNFKANLQALDKSKPYLVYCAVGGRSNQAVQTMEQMGFKQVYNASEGFDALIKAGISVE